MDRKQAARQCVDARIVASQIVHDYGHGTPEADGALLAADEADRVAERYGVTFSDLYEARLR